MAEYQEAAKNPAVLKGIAEAEKLADGFTNVTVNCGSLQQKDNQGRWVYGVITAHFPLKGYAALEKRYKSAGYNIERRKYKEYYSLHETTTVHVFARKPVQLVYAEEGGPIHD